MTQQTQTTRTTAQQFTTEEVTQRIPLLERIVADLVTGWGHVNDKRSQLEHFSTLSLLSETQEDELVELQDSLKRLVDKIHSCVREIQELGATVVEFRRGILAFSGRVEGRSVTFSWMLGEDSLQFFHEEYESFDRRRAITA